MEGKAEKDKRLLSFMEEYKALCEKHKMQIDLQKGDRVLIVDFDTMTTRTIFRGCLDLTKGEEE